jgi:hypothetical protein
LLAPQAIDTSARPDRPWPHRQLGFANAGGALAATLIITGCGAGQPKPGTVRDEAMRAGRTASSFPAADEDYFHDMDGGLSFTKPEIQGRNMWIVWTGGNDRLPETLAARLGNRVQLGTELVALDREAAASALEHVLATGDLAQFAPKQRIAYYLHICHRLGIASESRPFDWLTLDGKLVLYPNKSCTEQLRRQHQISVKLTRREIVGDLYVVEVEGSRPNGQTDFASKYVPLRDGRGNRLAGRDLANAFAKCETGAKRRLTLSMIGLAAVPDLDDVEKVRYVVVDAHRLDDMPALRSHRRGQHRHTQHAQ